MIKHGSFSAKLLNAYQRRPLDRENWKMYQRNFRVYGDEMTLAIKDPKFMINLATHRFRRRMAYEFFNDECKESISGLASLINDDDIEGK